MYYLTYMITVLTRTYNTHTETFHVYTPWCKYQSTHTSLNTHIIFISTISSPWHSNDPRPSPDFSSQLRGKIWEWAEDEAMLSRCVCRNGQQYTIWPLL